MAETKKQAPPPARKSLPDKLREWDEKGLTNDAVVYRDSKGTITVKDLVRFQQMYMPDAIDPKEVYQMVQFIRTTGLRPRVELNLLPFKKWNRNTHPWTVEAVTYAPAVDYRVFSARGRRNGKILWQNITTYYDPPESAGKVGAYPFKATLETWGPHNPPDKPAIYTVYWNYVAPEGWDWWLKRQAHLEKQPDTKKETLDSMFGKKPRCNVMWVPGVGDVDLALRKTACGRGSREFAPEEFGNLYLEEEYYSKMGQQIIGAETEIVDAEEEEKQPDQPPTLAGDRPTTSLPKPREKPKPEVVEPESKPPDTGTEPLNSTTEHPATATDTNEVVEPESDKPEDTEPQEEPVLFPENGEEEEL